MIHLLNANALHIPLAANTVQCVITSPPYWGLRDYGTAEWVGGSGDCDHTPTRAEVAHANTNASTLGGGKDTQAYSGLSRMTPKHQCPKCGAIRKDAQLGLEATPAEFLANMVSVFREVRRVLKDDGVLWLNMGDSYGDGKQLQGIPWRLAFALQDDGWILRSDIIWCLSGGTKVYAKTQKGVMPMTIKDMVRLDPSTVKLWNGEKWTQVLGWNESPRPDNPIEITLRSGERIGCTPGHQWPTQRGLLRADELEIGDVIQKTNLPAPCTDYQPWHLPDSIGWFVGLYLAEGSRSGETIQIASHIEEKSRFKKLQIVAADFGGTCAMHQTSENGATINLNGKVLNAIIDTYISGKTAKDKHLAVSCWQRTDDFLAEVLAGYLEGDGHYDETNDRWRLGFTRNYNLEGDMRTLCARLGLQLRLKKATSGAFKIFKGEIRFNTRPHHNTKDDGEIVAIGRSRARKFWDIGVADEPHLFALASGVLTHNSKPNPMPESVTDRPTKAHEYVFLLSKQGRYFYDAEAVKEKSSGNSGYAKQRKKGIANWSKATQNKNGRASLVGTVTGNEGNNKLWQDNEYRNKRTVWTVATQPYSGSHFATFPTALIEPMILAGSRPGDLVLDPFSGTATVGEVARKHHRRYVGLELNPEYIKLARERTRTIQPTLLDMGALL